MEVLKADGSYGFVLFGFWRRWAGRECCGGGIVVEVEDGCCWAGSGSVGVGEGIGWVGAVWVVV